MSAPSASVAKSPSAWEDLIDVFYAPTQVFERRRDGRFLVPLLVYVIASALLFVAQRPLMQPIFDRMASVQIAKAKEKNPQLTDEQLQTGTRLQEKLTTGVVGAAFATVGQVVTIFFVAFVLWLVGKAFGSAASYGQATMVTSYAFIPRLLGLLIGAVLLFFTPPESLTSMQSVGFSPARFLPADSSPALLALLGRIDLFTLWTTVLLGIGIAVVGRIPRGRGLTAAFTVWALASAGAVMNAIRAGM